MTDCEECEYYDLPATNDTCESCINGSEFKKQRETRLSRSTGDKIG